MQPGQHIHLVGIGGFGISAIARVLLGQGYRVSGSDRSRNTLTDALARDGVTIHEGHAAEYVEGADALIITSAAAADHVEVQAARARGIPVYKRNDIIAEIMRDKTVIAIAGTHGKTTTTAMVTHILRVNGHDPSYIVGGIMGNTGTNAGVGQGRAFVIEADEYDHMFLGLFPNIAVLTSIEYDHPDFFQTEAAMVDAFRRFAHLVDDILIACAAQAGVREILKSERFAARTITYGQGNVYAANIHMEDTRQVFDVVYQGNNVATVTLPLPGEHNIQNAIGAMLAAHQQGITFHESAAALATFKSTGRRFEVRGEANGIIVIDDYAHHPTAIAYTLAAARVRYPDHMVWAVWQPHTYSRTAQLLPDYAVAFSQAHRVIVTDIYAARETATEETITGQAAADALHHAKVTFIPALDEAAAYLLAQVQSPAVIVIMSAGDAPRIGERFLREASHA
ncbi:MAG: UDP-N-acetylmuramate--L-alanine ligase [Anaerolineae bacterium]